MCPPWLSAVVRSATQVLDFCQVQIPPLLLARCLAWVGDYASLDLSFILCSLFYFSPRKWVWWQLCRPHRAVLRIKWINRLKNRKVLAPFWGHSILQVVSIISIILTYQSSGDPVMNECPVDLQLLWIFGGDFPLLPFLFLLHFSCWFIFVCLLVCDLTELSPFLHATWRDVWLRFSERMSPLVITVWEHLVSPHPIFLSCWSHRHRIRSLTCVFFTSTWHPGLHSLCPTSEFLCFRRVQFCSTQIGLWLSLWFESLSPWSMVHFFSINIFDLGKPKPPFLSWGFARL